MNRTDILITLQKIEAGIIKDIPGELQQVLNNQHDTPEVCVICNADILISHHIKVYNSIRQYNGNDKAFLGIIGHIYICQNCHLKIHSSRNPYFGNDTSQLPSIQILSEPPALDNEDTNNDGISICTPFHNPFRLK